MLGLVATMSITGVGLYYLSTFVGVSVLILSLLPILVLNVIISARIKYEEPKESFRHLLQSFRTAGRTTLFKVDFLITLRRTFLNNYIPLILLYISTDFTSQKISFYLTLFTIPTIAFLFIGHKISNRAYLILSVFVFELASSLFVAVLYNLSFFIFLTVITLVKILSSLRAASAEQVLMRILNFSTRLSALFSLLDIVLSSVASLVISFMLEFKLYSIIILIIGFSTFLLNVIIYRMLQKY
ncbi:hypothetical protein J5U21_02044 [Saccharolobus shibatae]|uniref:Uncharacterized protein n=1 Tax=Saccharolobus shibatae TaxID=2286 RepID=A0A8F5BW32_9CREN|nr:hypothetical protein J5U21_02044 [Saccharolobus shibatae]